MISETEVFAIESFQHNFEDDGSGGTPASERASLDDDSSADMFFGAPVNGESDPDLMANESHPLIFAADGTCAHDDARSEAFRRFTRDVYDFLFPPDQRTLLSGLEVLALVRGAGLQLPRFNILLYPFLTVLEGFLFKLLIETGVMDLERYRSKPYNERLGGAIRNKALWQFITDHSRHDAILDRLSMAWSNIRCRELHNNSAREDRIFDLCSLDELENKLGELASLMVDSWRIFIEGRGEAYSQSCQIDACPQNLKNVSMAAPTPLAQVFSENALLPPAPVPLPSVIQPSAQALNPAPGLTPAFALRPKPAPTLASELQKPPESSLALNRTRDSRPGPPKLIAGPKVRIGTDESGKGDYFGPLVVAGVYCDERLEEGLKEAGVCDSKAATDNQNVARAALIKELMGPGRYEISVLQPARYNLLWESHRNINTILAMSHASVIDELLKRVDCGFVIVDQFANENLLKTALSKIGREVDLFQTTKGERDPAVAAASVLARAAFIEAIEAKSRELGEKIPKGAGKPVDDFARSALLKYGPEKLRELAKLHFRNSAKIGFDYLKM